MWRIADMFFCYGRKLYNLEWDVAHCFFFCSFFFPFFFPFFYAKNFFILGEDFAIFFFFAPFSVTFFLPSVSVCFTFDCFANVSLMACPFHLFFYINEHWVRIGRFPLGRPQVDDGASAAFKTTQFRLRYVDLGGKHGWTKEVRHIVAKCRIKRRYAHWLTKS